jgi:23S rRNA pseudouridine1911/1915/1917 synthase
MEVGKGKEAITACAVLRRFEGPTGERFALLSARPHTGRQHQIRAHLQAAGFPVVGDKLYGASEQIFLRFIEGRLTDDDRALLRVPRHALHAQRLMLHHPSDGRIRSWRSPIPTDLSAFMSGLVQHRIPR